ncbi:MAG: hypothetical protein IJR29_11555 [Butyrivibrio sp.]|nr:hypothetical protein [Butyrivibrio sp.]
MNEWSELKKFFDNISFFLFLGDETRSLKDIDDFISKNYLTEKKSVSSEFDSSSNTEEYLSKLIPLISESSKDNYSVDKDIIIDNIKKILSQLTPDMAISKLSDIETNGQDFKYLYENSLTKIRDFEAETFNMNSRIMDLEKQIADLSFENSKLKEGNDQLHSSTDIFSKFIRDFLDKDICIYDCKAVHRNLSPVVFDTDKKKVYSDNDISVKPGIYGGKRPSFFTPLQTELSKENVAVKNTKTTSSALADRLKFWKKMDETKLSVSEKADIVDNKRKTEILKLLNSDMSNAEKYLKYVLLTPGMSDDFMKTINGCEEIRLDANTVIHLLEQDSTVFNKKIIESYVSKAHKALDYNYKQELAEELIRGEWYITAIVQGNKERFELVPLDLINSIKEKLETIYDAIKTGNVPVAEKSQATDEMVDDGQFDALWQQELENTFNNENIENTASETEEEPDTSFEQESYL